MSDEMPSWRSLASSASRSIREYVAQRDWKKPTYATRDTTLDSSPDGAAKPSLRQWASQTLRSIAQPNGNVERLALFPGWAHRRYLKFTDNANADPSMFDVEVFISGFASQSSNAGFASSRGKAMLYMAKYYAALPKLRPDDPVGSDSTNSQVENDIFASVHLPAKPDDMTDEVEAAELVAQMRQLATETSSISTTESCSSSQSDSTGASSNRSSQTNYSELQRFHNNLESRLQPFVSSSLNGRPVRLAVYATDPQELDFKSPPLGSALPDVDYALWSSPIASETAYTAADGSFQLKVRVPWSKICAHPAAVNIAYGDVDEHALYVVAELMPGPTRPPSPNAQTPYVVRAPRISRYVGPTTVTRLTIPISHTTIRLISDIDDTVKMSGILSGAKATFYNVFVKDLADNVIPGMGDWYKEMWNRGVRVHYVSNSPFELLPVINEFISLSRLPQGSIKLKSYAGRSLFTDLLRAPAGRKRSGIIDVLDSFPDARFFLVGDSGEQDLELYAAFARERPRQILAVFIRDASNWDVVKPLGDPTGAQCYAPPSTGTIRRVSQALLTPGSVGQSVSSGTFRRPNRSVSGMEIETSKALYTVREPKRTQSAAVSWSSNYSDNTNQDYFSSSPPPSPLISESPKPYSFPPPGFSKSAHNVQRDREDNIPLPTSESTTPRPSSGRTSSTTSIRGAPAMSDAERKQYELQMRVYRARMEMPEAIPLRIFRDPTECVEAKQILDRLNFG